jgi:vitamin B12 transporter
MRLECAIAALLLAAAAGRVAAQFPPEIRGRVFAQGTGAAVAGAEVEVLGSPAHAMSDEAGRFVLRGADPGVVELRVRAIGFRPAQRAVRAENGEVVTVDVPLVPVAVRLAAVEVRAGRDRVPAGATVIERSTIAASGARDVGELLQGEAGVVVTRRGGPGAPAELSIRGSASSEVLVLVDGVPVNDPLTGAADLSTISPTTVERVTVLRGAQSARYGPRALGGVVAIELRHPVQHELEVRAGSGAWGEQTMAGSLGARAAAGAATLTGLVTGEWRAADGDFRAAVPAVRGGGDAPRENADARSGSLLASGGIERGGDALHLRVELTDAARGMPGPIVQPTLHARQAEQRLGAVVTARSERGAWGVQAHLALQRERVRFSDALPPLGAAYDDTVRAHGAIASADVSRRFAQGDVTAGVELRRLAVDATALDTTAPGTQRLAGGWLIGRWARTVTALGDRDAMLELTAAGRVDGSSLLRGATVSPRASAALTRHVGGTGALTARVSWGDAFSPPTLADQFFHEGVRSRANPSLRPERVRNEIEGTIALDRVRAGAVELSTSLAVYRADVDGMILWFPDFRFVWSPENVDVARRGWEATARLSAAPLHATLGATIGATDVTYDEPSLSGQVAYRPRVTASVDGDITLAGTRLGATVRHVGSRRTVPGSGLNALAPFTTTDARATHELAAAGWRLAASLLVDDVFDERPAMLVDYPAPGRTWRLLFTVGRGRGDDHLLNAPSH